MYKTVIAKMNYVISYGRNFHTKCTHCSSVDPKEKMAINKLFRVNLGENPFRSSEVPIEFGQRVSDELKKLQESCRSVLGISCLSCSLEETENELSSSELAFG